MSKCHTHASNHSNQMRVASGLSLSMGGAGTKIISTSAKHFLGSCALTRPEATNIDTQSKRGEQEQGHLGKSRHPQAHISGWMLNQLICSDCPSRLFKVLTLTLSCPAGALRSSYNILQLSRTITKPAQVHS